jgi:hypothetical protein
MGTSSKNKNRFWNRWKKNNLYSPLIGYFFQHLSKSLFLLHIGPDLPNATRGLQPESLATAGWATT